MALQSSGAISIANINTELGVASTTTRSLNDTVARTLAGVAGSGTTISMSNFYGKSSRVTVSYTYTTNTQNASLNVATIGGYVSGATTVTVTVNSGIYLWSDTTATPGFIISGATGGDTVTLVNNGYIIGKGGSGAGSIAAPGNASTIVNPSAGGTALRLGCNLTIQNNSYIAGGGGGGGGAGTAAGGGGGAGGGPATPVTSSSYVPGPTATYTYVFAGGGTAGGLGGGGGNGGSAPYTAVLGGGYAIYGGGGGGRILPGATKPAGSGTSPSGVGGGGGSGGGANNAGGNGYVVTMGANSGTVPENRNVGYGGQAGGSGVYAQGVMYYGAAMASSGGGGWGASGGNTWTAYRVPATPPLNTDVYYYGAAGGKCVHLNGFTATWSATGNRYGAIA